MSAMLISVYCILYIFDSFQRQNHIVYNIGSGQDNPV